MSKIDAFRKFSVRKLKNLELVQTDNQIIYQRRLHLRERKNVVFLQL